MEKKFQVRDKKSLLNINSEGHACVCWNPDESKGDLRESQKRILRDQDLFHKDQRYQERKYLLRKCSIEGKFECNPQTVEKQRERGFGDLGFVLGLLKLEA